LLGWRRRLPKLENATVLGIDMENALALSASMEVHTRAWPTPLSKRDRAVDSFVVHSPQCQVQAAWFQSPARKGSTLRTLALAWNKRA
jgi:hypothetical protein